METRSELSLKRAEAGRKGGKVKSVKGFATLTPSKRKRMAQLAALARWKKG